MPGRVKFFVPEDGLSTSKMPVSLLTRGRSLMQYFAAEIKISKNFVRFPILDRISLGDRQSATCRLKLMGAVRLAINMIAGLTDLFCWNHSQRPLTAGR